jgi:hypothetical protein
LTRRHINQGRGEVSRLEKVYCGIDWAENHHDVAVVDAEGPL